MSLRFSPIRRISIVAGTAWRLLRSSSKPEGDQSFARRGFAGACQEVWPIVWKQRQALFLAFVLVLVGRVTDFAFPLASKFLVDDVLVRQDWTKLAPVLGWVAAGALIGLGSSFAAAVVLDLGQQRAQTEYQRAVVAHVLRLPISFFDAAKTGTLANCIVHDSSGLRRLISLSMALLRSLCTAVVAVFVLFRLNWCLTAFTLLQLMVFGALLAFWVRRLRPHMRERYELMSRCMSRLAEGLTGIAVIKAYVAEKHEDRVFVSGLHRLLRNQFYLRWGMSGIESAAALGLGVVGLTILFAGANAIRAGTMTLGDVVMYVAVLAVLNGQVGAIAQVGPDLTNALAGIERVHDIRQRPTEVEENRGRRFVPHVFGNVEFRDVSFEYRPGTLVLRRVSFSAPAGSTTALVGASGSGKSTVSALLLAFYRPQSGQILIDGQDLTTLQASGYRRHLGVVLQDNFVFDGTIAENIAYTRPRATHAEIERASRLAHCDEFIGRLSDGYATVVGERGVCLSGGQRQRIAIARAILADPSMLILDEATSNLDSESERLIQDGLQQLRRGRTTFVIAHRLSTIRTADQILVLDHGQLVEGGRHDELLAMRGRYWQLYQSQYRFTKDDREARDITPYVH